MDIKITKSPTSRIHEVNFDDLPFGRTFADHMFVCDYENGAWQNPRIEPFHNFSLHPATMALHYGQAIFEGMKASIDDNGTPMLFRPERHAKRLNISAARLCMPEFPEDLFVEGLSKLVALDQNWIPKEEGSALYIRPTMIATDEFIGVKPSQSYKFFIFTGPVGPYYPKPVRLWAETDYIRAAQGGTGFAKAAGNYAGALYPAKLAQDRGFDQLLWLDAKEFKYIQESGTMNVFFVINGVTITPPLSGTILDGVTRDSILEILRSEGKPVAEHPITIDEVVQAYKDGTLQEAFGAGTAAVVSHVAEIGYRDLLMTLPPVSERKIGNHVKAVIDGLRSGKVEDKWGWTVPVLAEELV
ncbi:MAG: branched-chain amino acid aminotransferase [Saprospiraceae bacterium]|jgi:branched-chain amino acid aminotransferase|nr:branched-chain amino acid aminotransferase [Saprospiraceae bacterium]